MRKILTFIAGVVIIALSSCSYECKDPNFIETTTTRTYSKLLNKWDDSTEVYHAKFHVRGDSVFLCVKKWDEYLPDTKFVNDSIITYSDLCNIYYE